jgi:hypothetical protein
MLNLRLDSLIFFAFADCFLANAAFWHGHTHFLELVDSNDYAGVGLFFRFSQCELHANFPKAILGVRDVFRINLLCFQADPVVLQLCFGQFDLGS